MADKLLTCFNHIPEDITVLSDGDIKSLEGKYLCDEPDCVKRHTHTIIHKEKIHEVCCEHIWKYLGE